MVTRAHVVTDVGGGVTARSNWTSSIETGEISAAHWLAARARAHTCLREERKRGEETRAGGEITVLGEFSASGGADIMLHRGEAGTPAITWRRAPMPAAGRL